MSNTTLALLIIVGDIIVGFGIHWAIARSCGLGPWEALSIPDPVEYEDESSH